MSRTATNEYIGAKRRAYESAGPDKRRRLLDGVCETTGYERKYANKLLTGNRKFRERKGRGRKYTDEHFRVLIDVWKNVGCPCTTYFMAQKEEWLREYQDAKGIIRPGIARDILAMSASTMDRALKGVLRAKLGSIRANRRSGLNAALLNAIEYKSGEEVMAGLVDPGDVQVDTVALCGGDMAGNFWWTLTGTDRKTQWTNILPTWNHGMFITCDALKRIVGRMPFRVRSLHHDIIRNPALSGNLDAAQCFRASPRRNS